MAEWNNNNLACLKTWIHLKILHQHNKVFKDAGKLKMNQLTFWNQSSSAELRSLAAETICHQLDNMFRLFDKTVYESGSDNGTAINAMHEIMIDEQKTVFDLSVIIDNNYKFRGESEDEAIL